MHGRGRRLTTSRRGPVAVRPLAQADRRWRLDQSARRIFSTTLVESGRTPSSIP